MNTLKQICVANNNLEVQLFSATFGEWHEAWQKKMTCASVTQLEKPKIEDSEG